MTKTKKEIEEEIRWRENAQSKLPTGANQRRINYLRECYKEIQQSEDRWNDRHD